MTQNGNATIDPDFAAVLEDYRSTFDTPTGRRVLKHLCNVLNGKSTVELSPFEQGKRAAYWKIASAVEVAGKLPVKG